MKKCYCGKEIDLEKDNYLETGAGYLCDECFNKLTEAQQELAKERIEKLEEGCFF